MKSIVNGWRSALVAGALSVGPGVALAWDGIIQGVPTQIDVTTDFRVYISAPTGGSGWCNASYNWAYLIPTDSNYSAYVAAILMAKATGSSLMIFQTRDANGYCHIGYIAVT